MFAFAWFTRDFVKNSFLLILACGYFWIGSLDLIHTLVYKGMNVFVEGSGNLSVQFWIATRYSEALLLLFAPLAAAKKQNGMLLFITFGLTAFALTILIASGQFPTTFIEGKGLTDFKIYSEYLIVFILLIAIINIFKKGHNISTEERNLITVSIIMTIFAELAFTFYVSMYGLSNLAGHIFKLFSYWFIFQAIILSNIRKPYINLQQSEIHSRNLFENSEISLWNEDFTQIFEMLQKLKQNGVTDLVEYLKKNKQLACDLTHSIKVTHVNQATLKLFGANNETELIDHIDKTFTESSIEIFIMELNAIWNNQSTFRSEVAFKTLDDRDIQTIISFQIPRTKNGFSSIPVSITDITERKLTERGIRRAQKMDAVGQLTGGIAHDFNNILGIIIGNLSFLKKQVTDDEKALRRINTINKATQRAANLTNQLLGFSRKKTTDVLPTNINLLIKGMESLITRSVTPEVEIDQQLTDNLWYTDIEPGEFEDALLNLTLNARDAMPGTGKLTIETCNTTLDKAYCNQNQSITPGEYVQLSFSDTGKGIPRKQQDRIFEPFFTTKPEGTGTGLGLAMVFGFTSRTNGHIKVYSELGIGTTFRLYLPRSKKQILQKDPVAPLPESLPRGNETILAVDDEEGLLELAKESLQTLGYKVLIANNVLNALEVLAAEPSISLLFSDVVMPGSLNGYELAEKATANQPDLKVILTSGYTKKTLAHNGQSRFNANLLSKPYTQSELAQRIRSLLGEIKPPSMSHQHSTQKTGSIESDINWSDTLSIGIEPIDQDHKILINLINRSQQIDDIHTDKNQLNSILLELMRYTEYNFSREEAIMKACSYPSLNKHHQVHQLLIKQVEEKLRLHQQNKVSVKQLREFLLSWVTDHIQGMDKSFAPFCKGKEKLISQVLKQLDADFNKGTSS